MNMVLDFKKAAAKINENIEYEVTTLYEVLAKEKTTYSEMLDTVKRNKPFNHDEIQLTIYSKLIEKINKEALSKTHSEHDSTLIQGNTVTLVGKTTISN